jgi:hypothetical protein
MGATTGGNSLQGRNLKMGSFNYTGTFLYCLYDDDEERPEKQWKIIEHGVGPNKSVLRFCREVEP